jgi:hypothetical protein
LNETKQTQGMVADDSTRLDFGIDIGARIEHSIAPHARHRTASTFGREPQPVHPLRTATIAIKWRPPEGQQYQHWHKRGDRDG